MDELSENKLIRKHQLKRLEELGTDLHNLIFKYRDKYIEHYNKDPIRALADFESIKSTVKKRYEDVKDALIDDVNFFKDEIDLFCAENEDPQPFWKGDEEGLRKIGLTADDLHDLPDDSKVDSLREEVFEEINSFYFKRGYIYAGTEQSTADEIIFLLAKIYERVRGEEYKGFGIDYFEEANKKRRILEELRFHIAAINMVREAVLDRGMPESVEPTTEMSKEAKKELKKEVEGRFRLQKNDYWQTAYKLYKEVDSKIWKDVWEEVEEMRKDEGLPSKYSTFDSFKRNKSRYDHNQISGEG